MLVNELALELEECHTHHSLLVKHLTKPGLDSRRGCLDMIFCRGCDKVAL